MDTTPSFIRSSRSIASRTLLLAALVAIPALAGCENADIRQRRVDVPQGSGADPDLQARFGLTNDAQDPTQKQKELGAGWWKSPDETEGTKSPTSPSRRRGFD